MKRILKLIGPDVAAVLVFVAVSVIYMFPAMRGKTLAQHDSTAGIGAGREAAEYFDRTGEKTRWTNSLFSGMPTYQMSPAYPAYSIVDPLEKAYHLFLPSYVWYLFALLVGFYILMRVIGCKVPVSVFGALIWAFSSYFCIIISAGHIWKVMTLAYIPPTIAGMMLIYRSRRLPGALVLAFFTALQIKANHLQMTYYFLFVMAALFIAFAVEAVRSKKLGQFGISTAVFVCAGLLGVAVNASNLYHTYQYSKETIRGGSELTARQGDSSKATNGLDRDYITAWSYGLGETFTLLVPNAKGGATAKGDYILPMTASQIAMSKADKDYVALYRQFPQYWGEQPMTSGPVYVGAFVCLLFLLGLLIAGGPVKWALLAVTVLSILLSWGHNFQWFTDLFIDYMPLYSKFRTVSSILVIAEFTIPLLAVMGLVEYLRCVGDGSLKQRKYCGGRLSADAAFMVSFAVTGGLCLLFAVAPGVLGSVISSSEWSFFEDVSAQYAGAGYTFPVDSVVYNLRDMRYAMVTADSLRSLAFIAAGALVLLLMGKGKVKSGAGVCVLAAVCLIDMWSVNRRYLSSDMFRTPSAKEESYQMTDADRLILMDKDPDYRVLNFADGTFNENRTSYWHKSIGGYHAAKLRRYQEIIDEFITPEMNNVVKSIVSADGDVSQLDPGIFPVINMLNAKYFILPAEEDATLPVLNPHCYGNAWFVDSLVYAADADEEMASLHRLDPRRTAVVDRRFSDEIGNMKQGALPADAESFITLKEYEPNRLVYDVSSPTGGLAVFSEIYYPGWTAELDGAEIPIGRADYVLRCARIPAGVHGLVLSFNPRSLHITDAMSYVALALMLLALVGTVGYQCFTTKRNRKNM